IFALSSYGNKYFQAGEPWKTRNETPSEASSLIKSLAYLIRDLGIMIEPYLPDTSDRILAFFGISDISWNQLGQFSGLKDVQKTEILFQKLEDDLVNRLREKFSGSQDERRLKEIAESEGEGEGEGEENMLREEIIDEQFNEFIDLRAAKIIEITRHPEADKLYIETLNAGDEEPRQIVSGLVPYYTEEELLGRTIILVYNLKPANLRGIKSQGMLLAASTESENNGIKTEQVEVLFADWAKPGQKISIGNLLPPEEAKQRVKIDKFFSLPLVVKNHEVYAGESLLSIEGRNLRTSKVVDGDVG
ncbi:MAG: methionine--tRNA ligase, partial [Candidatus Brocadiales bacterium]|nr:methionine--tRNA ligase [Candidatus Brocadiales bacterium]